MRRTSIIIAGVLLVAVVVVSAFVNAPRPPKPPKPKTVVLALDVERELQPFARDDMAAAAQTWAGVLCTFADVIERDGMSLKPRIRLVDDVRRIRDNIVGIPIDGVPGGIHVGLALASTLDALDVGELTKEKRKIVVDAFRSVGRYLGGQ